MLAFEKVVNALEERHFHAFYHDFGCTFYHPKMLLATLLFAYSQGIFSGRKMRMEELIRDLFIDLNLRLKIEEFVTLDCLFIDGTKIEANANKYSFV